MKFWTTAPFSVDIRAFLFRSAQRNEIETPHGAILSSFLSVRSIWAAILQSSTSMRGGEVILSAVNIPHMHDLIEACGLSPRYADIESDSLIPTIEALEKGRSDRTRIVLIAHLFGSWSSISHIAEWAHKHNILVVEDCAQCYLGRDFFGTAEADFSMFSFGLIKRRTAGAGAILISRNMEFFTKIESLTKVWPFQSRREYLGKIWRVAIFAGFTLPFPFSTVLAILKAQGREPEVVIRASLRGYPDAKLPDRFHRQPHRALVKRLKLSWASSQHSDWQLRSESIWRSLLGNIPRQYVPGYKAQIHSFWAFPVFFEKSEDAIQLARKKGGYAISGLSSLRAFTEGSDRIIRRAVFFPVRSSSKNPNPFAIDSEFVEYL